MPETTTAITVTNNSDDEWEVDVAGDLLFDEVELEETLCNGVFDETERVEEVPKRKVLGELSAVFDVESEEAESAFDDIGLGIVLAAFIGLRFDAGGVDGGASQESRTVKL